MIDCLNSLTKPFTFTDIAYNVAPCKNPKIILGGSTVQYFI